LMQKPKKEAKETTIYQKLNTFADWFIRLVMINILIIIASLPVITFYPALCAGHRLFDDYIKKDETPIFKGFYTYIKLDFVKKLWLGLLLFFTGAFGYYNVTYYVAYLNEGANWFFSIGYYVTFAVLVGIYAVTLYTIVVLRAFPKLKLGMIFKLSFYLSGKYFLITIALMALSIVPVILLMTPTLFLLFVFFGISTPLFGYTFLTQKPLAYVESLGETHD
jgi:uncharacterized membrane protein YesL